MNSELIYTTFFLTYLPSCLIGITKHGCNKSLASCSPYLCSSASLTHLSKCNHNLQSTRQSGNALTVILTYFPIISDK